MSIICIWFKWTLSFNFNEMIQLFPQLIIAPPPSAGTLCQTTASNGQTIFYGNWGYAQIDAVVLTPGQKYNIQLETPGYVTLSLGYYINTNYVFSSPSNPPVSSVDFYYSTFNLNDYNSYITNNTYTIYEFGISNFNSTSFAYGYVDTNGFTIDLTQLPSQYAIILGLLKFDLLTQFNTYNYNNYTYNIYGMSTVSNNIFTSSVNSVNINTSTFLGIPVNTTVQFSNPTYFEIGYQLNNGFLVNDETVSNSAFNFPTDKSNVAGLVNYASPFEVLQPPSASSPEFASLTEFGSPENIQYSAVVYYNNNTEYTYVNGTGSNPASGLPNTNAIVASSITLPFPLINSNIINLKSPYNNNGYNDIWVFSSNNIFCTPINSSSSNVYYILPAYFTPWNGQTYPVLNSNNPSILLQYILQPPIVQVTSTSSTTNITTTQNITSSTVQSSTPTTQASSTTSTSTSTSTTSTQSTTSTANSTTTSNITITNITEKIVTALANPIVALILALALVGIAIFVLV